MQPLKINENPRVAFSMKQKGSFSFRGKMFEEPVGRLEVVEAF